MNNDQGFKVPAVNNEDSTRIKCWQCALMNEWFRRGARANQAFSGEVGHWLGLRLGWGDHGCLEEAWVLIHS